MRYDVEQQLKARRAKQTDPIKLPVIINFVVYAGKKYEYPKRLIDAFRTPDLLYRMFEDNFLIHLKKEEEEIMQDGEAALAEVLLREGHRKDFCKFLTSHPKIAKLLNESTYAQSAIMYILDRDPHDVGEVLDKLINLDPKIKDNVMTALQRKWQEGRQEGRQEGYKEIIERMLAKGRSLKEISEDIGLPASEIKKLLPKKIKL